MKPTILVDDQGVSKNKIVSIASITRSGTVATVITTTPHYMVDGESVHIRGATPNDYNVDREVITKVDEHTLTFSVATSPASPATGTLTMERAVLSDDFDDPIAVNGNGEQLVRSGGHTKMMFDEISRPANTTAYTLGDVVGLNLAVTGATNATPIVVTTATHGLETGDKVTIAGVGGNTAADGDWEVTVISTTTFSLKGSVGNGSYTTGGTVARAFAFHLASRLAGEEGYILNIMLMTNLLLPTNGSFRVYIMSEPPASMPVDNAPYQINWADKESYVAKVDLVLVAEAAGDSAMAYNDSIRLAFKTSTNFRTLYACLVAQGAYVPASGQTLRLGITAEQN